MEASIHRLDIPQDKTKYVLVLNFHFTGGYVHLNKIEGRLYILKKNRIAPKTKTRRAVESWTGLFGVSTDISTHIFIKKNIKIISKLLTITVVVRLNLHHAFL